MVLHWTRQPLSVMLDTLKHTIWAFYPVLRIRDPESRIRIFPSRIMCQKATGPRIRNKELKVFLTQNVLLSSWKCDKKRLSWIPDPEPGFGLFPPTGSKHQMPDPQHWLLSPQQMLTAKEVYPVVRNFEIHLSSSQNAIHLSSTQNDNNLPSSQNAIHLSSTQNEIHLLSTQNDIHLSSTPNDIHISSTQNDM